MGKNPGFLSAWTYTVGSMIPAVREGAVVIWSCSTCGAGGRPVNLQAICDKFGPDYSLVNREPPCRTPGCKGKVHFRTSAGKSTMNLPLFSYREGDRGPWIPLPKDRR